MERYDFGNRVAQLRKSKDMTQAQLAEVLGVSNKTVSRWETGEGYPDFSLLKPLANALGVSIDYLLGNEEMDSADESGNGKTEVKNLSFNWRRPRWNDLTKLNKIATITAALMIIYLLIWGSIVALNNSQLIEISEMMLPFIPLVYLILFKFGSTIGAGCAISGLVLGEMGKYERQKNVAIIVAVLNLLLPYVVMLI